MLRVVGCLLEYDGKFPLLLRHAHKPEGNTWGLPAGKAEANETDEKAALRELYEETGYAARASELEYVREDIFEFDTGVVLFIVYRVSLTHPHHMRLEESAHQAYTWVTLSEARTQDNLIQGLPEVFDRIAADGL